MEDEKRRRQEKQGREKSDKRIYKERINNKSSRKETET